MDGKERVIRHLEMTQGAINPLGGNSFLLKSWSMTALIATMVLISRQDASDPYLALSLILPIAGFFWILDGYFLWRERLFCKVYDEVRQQDETNFKMDFVKYRHAPKCSWRESVFSVTPVFFYSIEIAFTLLVFAIIGGR